MRHLTGWVLGGAEPIAAGGGFYLIRQAGACHLSCFASVSLIIVVQLRLSLVGLCDSARFRFAVSATGGAHLRAQGGRQRKRGEQTSPASELTERGRATVVSLTERSETEGILPHRRAPRVSACSAP